MCFNEITSGDLCLLTEINHTERGLLFKFRKIESEIKYWYFKLLYSHWLAVTYVNMSSVVQQKRSHNKLQPACDLTLNQCSPSTNHRTCTVPILRLLFLCLRRVRSLKIEEFSLCAFVQMFRVILQYRCLWDEDTSLNFPTSPVTSPQLQKCWRWHLEIYTRK